MLIIYAPIVILFGLLIAIRLRTGIAIAEFTRDPLGFAGIPVYTGSVSNLGVLIWAAAAAICFFSVGVMRSRSTDHHTSAFLLAGGSITTVLMLDDLFMLHEVVYPEHFGIPEGLAFVGFATSIGADAIASKVSIPGMYVFEDGGKLFGIVNWAAYFVQASTQYVRSDGHRPAHGATGDAAR